MATGAGTGAYARRLHRATGVRRDMGEIVEASSPLGAWLERPNDSVRYLVYCRAFAAASAIHLLLPDALQEGWLVPDLLYWVGAILLAATGCLAGWVLCAAGVAWPVLFLGDQLTQSIYLLLCALSAIACFAGRRDGRAERTAVGLPYAVRWLTVLVYALAAVHKVNAGFLDPEVSCATGGVDILARNWGAPWIAADPMKAWWPIGWLVVEGAIAVLLVVRPAVAIALACFVHVPLTIVFAPAFAFVTASGFVAALSETDLLWVGRVMRRRWTAIVAIGAALGIGSFLLYLRNHWVVYGFWSFKEGILWLGGVWLVAAHLRRPPGSLSWFSAFRERPVGTPRAIGIAVVLILVAWGLTPYTGLQFHHTGAMLSNLRIDRGCWNSLVFPEAMRIVEPYVRIDHARIGAGRPDLEAHLEEGLWSPEALLTLREDSCAHLPRPVRIEGTWHGRRFDSADLCNARRWPFGRTVLPRYRAFQHNLRRECPQACIH